MRKAGSILCQILYEAQKEKKNIYSERFAINKAVLF